MPSQTAARSRTPDLDASIDRLTRSARPAGAPPATAKLDRILACVTADDATPHVLAWARELGHLFGAHVTLLHVTTPLTPAPAVPAIGWAGLGAPAVVPSPDPEADRARVDALLADARRKVESDVAEVHTLRRTGHAGDEIARAANELASDLVVIGGASLAILDRILLGSTTAHVLAHANASVLVARADPIDAPVLAAVDGSAHSRTAAALADAIARPRSQPLHLLHVATRREPEQDALTTSDGVTMEIATGPPRDEILLAAERAKTDLIAIGARGHGAIRALLLGSVTDHIARTSPSSVLVGRTPE